MRVGKGMSRGEYTKMLKADLVRMLMLSGHSEREAKAEARPAQSIDDLKARNQNLRNGLIAAGLDTWAEPLDDDATRAILIDKLNALASAMLGAPPIPGVYDGRTTAELRRMLIEKASRHAVANRQLDERVARERVAAREEDATLRAEMSRPDGNGPAARWQVNRIIELLRERGGDPLAEGGFMRGPTDRAGIARLTYAEATAYLDSLKGTY